MYYVAGCCAGIEYGCVTPFNDEGALHQFIKNFPDITICNNYINIFFPGSTAIQVHFNQQSSSMLH